MLTGKKIILFGAGIVGRRALNFFGHDRVYCFVDNNKSGQIFFGKQIISFDDLLIIKDEYDVVISTSIESAFRLEQQCKSGDVMYKVFGDFVSYESYESNPDIKQFKNRHKGQRCFLVGNGPSLKAEDLTKLHEKNEISFGCNAISKIFNQTPWRPMYFVVTAPLFFLEAEMLADTVAEHKFFSELSEVYLRDTIDLRATLNQGRGEIHYIRPISATRTDIMPRFSPDPSRALYAAGTVMYIMIQLAVYMGFNEIYLTGVDGGSANHKNLDKYLSEKHHFYEENEKILREYYSYVMPTSPEFNKKVTTNAYVQADKYTRNHGKRIINTTRGGVLDMFERLDFDSLF